MKTLKERIEFVREEPGTLVIAILGLVFILFAPKSGCDLSDRAPAPAEGSSVTE